jgi:hypothetical protein
MAEGHRSYLSRSSAGEQPCIDHIVALRDVVTCARAPRGTGGPGATCRIGDTDRVAGPVVIGDLELSGDVGAASWVLAGVRSFEEHSVGALLPDGFGAYARVFHPALLRAADGLREVRWQEVAAANARRAHPAMEWGSITGSWHLSRQDGLWDQEPATGSLPVRQGERLADLLALHTATPKRCCFAVWEGFAVALPWDTARVPMPQRPMWLLRGPLSRAAASLDAAWGRSASLWWPQDRAWCVATDVDLMSTYVGGGEECIAAVLAADGLEAMPVTIDQRVTWETDSLNPRVPPPP